VRKLLTTNLQILAILGLNVVLDGTGNRIIYAKDGAMDQLDLPRVVSMKASGASGTCDLSSSPRLSRACLTSRVRGGGSTRHTKWSSWVRNSRARVRRRVAVREATLIGGIRLVQSIGRSRADRRCGGA
jgi:hypothetical protein